MHRKSRTRKPPSPGWTSDTVNVNVRRLVKDTWSESSLREAHGHKWNANPRRGWSYSEQPPPYDQSEQQDHESANLDAQFPVSLANSKIVTEQFWINPVTSNIVLQPLEPDTHSEKSRRICISSSIRKCPKWNANILETLRRDEVSGRDQGLAENCSDSTSAKVSTDGPDPCLAARSRTYRNLTSSRPQLSRRMQWWRFFTSLLLYFFTFFTFFTFFHFHLPSFTLLPFLFSFLFFILPLPQFFLFFKICFFYFSTFCTFFFFTFTFYLF